MSFDPSESAKEIFDIIKSKTKDDNKLIKLVTSKTKEERIQIRSVYKSLFNSDLIEDLKSNYHFNFKEVLIGLFYSPVEYDCYHIRKAVKGLGTDEDALIEILATREPERIKEMKEKYKEMFPNRDMVEDIKNDTSGNFWEILNALLNNERGNNTQPDFAQCKKWADQLFL